MFVIFVLTFFIQLWLFLYNRNEEKGLRQTFLQTFLLTFGFVFITTEVLSLFHLINKYSFIFLWCFTNLILALLNNRQNKTEFRKILLKVWQGIKDSPKIYLVLTSIIYLITLIISFCYPPNTYDSMTYHLARVGHWIQSGSVEFYPTAILRQLYQAPLAEYSILHLQLLSGNDYFANFPQWISFVACGIAVSLIVKELGEDFKTQFLAVVFSATIPMAIVQSTGTQNDLVVSIFVVSFFYYWLRAVKTNSWTDFALVGISLGLAILSKGTAYLFCFPIGLAFVGVHFWSLKTSLFRINFLKKVVLVLLIALSFNVINYGRNYSLFGSPVTSGEDKVSNENLTAKMFLANLTRNYAIHLGTKSEMLNYYIDTSVANFLGEELHNPDSTWMNNKFNVTFSTHEDSANNPLHLLLITLALLILPFLKGKDRKYIICLVFSVFIGFILYSLLLKWQIWASRLQLPLFILGSVLISIFISKFIKKYSILLVIIFFLLSISYLIDSSPRSVINIEGDFALFEGNRQHKYFVNIFMFGTSYIEASNFVKNQPQRPENVGLFIGFNDYEYPFWVFLKDDFAQKPFIYHVGVENVSGKLIGERMLPDYVIATKDGNIIEGIEYNEIWVKGNVRVLVKK